MHKIINYKTTQVYLDTIDFLLYYISHILALNIASGTSSSIANIDIIRRLIMMRMMAAKPIMATPLIIQNRAL